MTRFWLSWTERALDYRPLTYPPNAAILGWWKSGESEDGRAILCAVVESKHEKAAWAAIRKDWPGKKESRFCENRGPFYSMKSDRFPLSDWMVERMEVTE